MTNWRRVRLDRIAPMKRSVVDVQTLGDRVVLYSIPAYDTVGGPIEESTANIGSDKQTLSGGEVLISKLNPRKTRVMLVAKHYLPAVSSTEFIALRPMYVDPRWLCYWLSSERVHQELAARVQSVTRSQQRVEPSDLCHLWLDLPTPREQQSIANFLDAETERLDHLIAARHKMMQLLDSRFAVLAEDLTTGRTQPDVRFSGTTWMPTVAADWSLPAISHLFEVGSGTTPQSDDDTFYDGGIPWVNTGDLTDGPVLTIQRTVSVAALQKYPTLRLYPSGSLVVAMYGATIGKLGILEAEACVNQACCVLRRHPDSLLERWAFFWMLGHREGIISMATGGGQPNISQEDIRRFRIPIPTTATIAPTLARLEREHVAKAELARGMERQIDLLTERRRSVITAAVTGQIPIAGVA